MLLAKINETECVGCTKCIAACPVDAIVGAAKFMHSVLIDECIGCKLCVAPCPMDCIEMIESNVKNNSEIKAERALNAKKRYQARQERLIKEAPPKLTSITMDAVAKSQIRLEIAQSVKRVKEKLIPP